MKLNLGCGTDIKQGYVNLDIIGREGVDVVHDLNRFPYPFSNDQFDEIYASHVIEHVDDVLRVLEELYRILKNDGYLRIKVPYFSSFGAFQDPTHKHFFAEDTIRFYIAQNGYNRNFRFQVVNQKLNYTLPFRHIPFLKNVCRHFLLNVVSEMAVELKTVK